MTRGTGRFGLAGAGLRVEIDAATGTVASCRAEDGFEYARLGRRGLGDWRLAARSPGAAWSEWASHETPRTISESDVEGGVTVEWRGDRSLRVRARHRIDSEPVAAYVIEWELENGSKGVLEVGDLALPFPVNDDLRDGPLERRVFLHPFVAGHGSFFRIARGLGDGPDLVAICGPGTAPEEWARSLEADEAPAARTFPGVSEAYLFSAASRERSWPADGPNGHRSLRLEPGERRAFSLRFFLASGDSEREKILLRHGKLSIRVLPGLVLPNDLDAKLRIATDVPIRAMETLDGETTIDTVGKREKGQIFRVRVGGSGRRRIRIHYGKDEWTQITFLATAPLRHLLEARARFVAEHQRCLDPDDPMGRRDAFLSFDSARGAIHTDDDRKDLVSGRGSAGSAEPLFLALKNLAAPEPNEIDAISAFVRTHVVPSVESGRLAADWGPGAVSAALVLFVLADVKRATNLPHDFEAADLDALAAEAARLTAPSGDAAGELAARRDAPYDPERVAAGDPSAAAAVRAARSDAPTFERFSCDRRWWEFPARGKVREPDECGLACSSPIGSAVLLAAGPRAPGDKALDLAYGGLLAPFGNVEESGVAHAGYRSEPARRGFDALSGDVARGLVGAMRSLASLAVDDPEYGPVGYGCVLERRFDDWRVIPRDGLGKSVIIQPLGLRVRITFGDLTEVLASESRTRLVVTIASDSELVTRTRLTVEGLADGEYDVVAPASPPGRTRVEHRMLILADLELSPARRRIEIGKKA